MHSLSLRILAAITDAHFSSELPLDNYFMAQLVTELRLETVNLEYLHEIWVSV